MSEYSTPGRWNTVAAVVYSVLGLMVVAIVAMFSSLVIDSRKAATKREQAKAAEVVRQDEQGDRIEQVWWKGDVRVYRDVETGCEYMAIQFRGGGSYNHGAHAAIEHLQGTCAPTPPHDGQRRQQP